MTLRQQKSSQLKRPNSPRPKKAREVKSKVKSIVKKSKSKAIPVTGRGGLYGCEMLRILHCLDNRLRDGGKVVSPTH
jgi:hypothetical protein